MVRADQFSWNFGPPDQNFRRTKISVTGHLPREISRYTYYIIVHGASVSCKVIDVHHRRSPLVQGGLEIPCEVTVTMNYSQENVRAMAEYTRLIQEKYEEPTDGHFPDATQTILDSLNSL